MKNAVIAFLCMMGSFAGCMQTTEKSASKSKSTAPQIAGEMRKVMREGTLGPAIALDTISHASPLYGLGPAEYLSGEIIILDGKGYLSTVKDGSIAVTETLDLKAPFFGYARIESWKEIQMPDTVASLEQLEHFLTENIAQEMNPFFFKVTATVDSANIHVMALPKGTPIKSPQEAHALGRKDFQVLSKEAELLGFFSTEHQAVFTHHDTFVHIHLLTDDLKEMGHLDALRLRKATARLFVPLQ